MITPTNYSKQTMRQYIKELPHGSAIEIAEKCSVSIDVVRNVYYGKQYNADVIREIVKRYNKVVKSSTQVK